MIRISRLSSLLFAVMSIVLACCVVSCSSPVQPPAANQASKPAGQLNLYVNFNGPWAFMQDPTDSSKIVAIAPYIKEHQSAYVAATNETPVDTGAYEISGLPSATLNVSPELVVVKDTISMKTFNDVAQNAGGNRYLIRLPMPTDLASYRNGREAVAGTWPVPSPNTTQKWYTTHMTLHYSVSDLGAIKLTGTTDAKNAVNFAPVVGPTGALDIGVGPLYDLQETDCHDHGKGAFKALVGLFKVHQFIDFPGTDGQYHQAKCGPSDPQKPSGPPAVSPGHLGRTGADCKAAMLLLSVTNP
jgi:hypothetical protein